MDWITQKFHEDNGHSFEHGCARLGSQSDLAAHGLSFSHSLALSFSHIDASFSFTQRREHFFLLFLVDVILQVATWGRALCPFEVRTQE